MDELFKGEQLYGGGPSMNGDSAHNVFTKLLLDGLMNCNFFHNLVGLSPKGVYIFSAEQKYFGQNVLLRWYFA